MLQQWWHTFAGLRWGFWSEILLHSGQGSTRWELPTDTEVHAQAFIVCSNAEIMEYWYGIQSPSALHFSCDSGHSALANYALPSIIMLCPGIWQPICLRRPTTTCIACHGHAADVGAHLCMACVVSCLLSLRTAPEAVYSDDVSTLVIPAGCPFRCTAVLTCSMASSAASRSSCATNLFQTPPAVHQQSCTDHMTIKGPMSHCLRPPPLHRCGQVTCLGAMQPLICDQIPMNNHPDEPWHRGPSPWGASREASYLARKVLVRLLAEGRLWGHSGGGPRLWCMVVFPAAAARLGLRPPVLRPGYVRLHSSPAGHALAT